MKARWAGARAALLLFGACVACGGSATASTSGGGCGHPGLCLTFSGPLTGANSGLVQVPDCITGNGLDMEFVTHIGNRETSVEIMITDVPVKSSPGFHPGSFDIKTRAAQVKSTAFASIWVKPDRDVAGFPNGWSSDVSGSSGAVTVNANESGKIQNATLAPATGSGASIHVGGTFNCR